MHVLAVLLTSGPDDLHRIGADDVVRLVAAVQLATEEDHRLPVALESQSGRQILPTSVEAVHLRRGPGSGNFEKIRFGGIQNSLPAYLSRL